MAELYAGCGAIGLGLLARRCRELRLNEASPDALAGLARGLAARPAGERARARPAGPASAALEALAGADVVIVGPPRRGSTRRSWTRSPTARRPSSTT